MSFKSDQHRKWFFATGGGYNKTDSEGHKYKEITPDRVVNGERIQGERHYQNYMPTDGASPFKK